MKTALLITTDEKFQEIEFFNELDYFYKHIECDLIEIVRPIALQQVTDTCENLIMIVDEEGLLRDSPKLNIYASAFYGRPLYGNVMIVKEIETPDGLDFAGMERDDHKELSAAMVKLFTLLEKQYHN